MTDYNEDFDNSASETILDIETGDAKEPTIVEAGEYQIRITGFRKDNSGKIVRTSDSGNRYFIVSFDIPGDPYSKGFSKIFSVPSTDMEPKRLNSIKWELECFKRAFGLVEINFNDMVGKEGWALLKVTHSDQYGDQNDIAKFISGPLEVEMPF